MRCIVGLGNPGLAYRLTRHNTGFMVVDRLARKHGIALSRRRFRARYGEGRIRSGKVVLIKPQTYMNLSGISIRGFLDVCDFSLQDLLVIHDDLDVGFGMIRIKAGGGHGGHRGVQSITESLGGSDFVRVRVGIGRPQGGLDATAHVLGAFSRKERANLERILLWAVEAVETILFDGVERAMNVFNGARIGDNEET